MSLLTESTRFSRRLALLQREADVRDLDAQIRLEQRRASRNRESLLREQELLTLVQNDVRYLHCAVHLNSAIS